MTDADHAEHWALDDDELEALMSGATPEDLGRVGNPVADPDQPIEIIVAVKINFHFPALTAFPNHHFGTKMARKFLRHI